MRALSGSYSRVTIGISGCGTSDASSTVKSGRLSLIVSAVFVAAGLSCLLARPKTSSFQSTLMRTGVAKTSKSPPVKTVVACVLWRMEEEVGEGTTAQNGTLPRTLEERSSTTNHVVVTQKIRVRDVSHGQETFFRGFPTCSVLRCLHPAH